jgi:glycosyltransferase involved in cell wall biosynthesis
VSRHGIYQRFRMLMESAADTGLALELVCEEGGLVKAGSPDACARLEAGVLQHWGLVCRVMSIARRVEDSRTPYLLQQLAGCVSHDWSPAHRAAREGGQVAQLNELIAPRHRLLLVHRLGSMAVLLDCLSTLPCVFDMDDVEHVVHMRRMDLGGSLRERLVARAALPALKRLERAAVRRAALTLVCAADDAKLIQDLAGVAGTRVAVVPNGVTVVEPRSPDRSAPPVLLMVGIYSYEPNSEGARFFIEQVWPIIRRAVPTAEVWFVGASPQAICDADNLPDGVKLLGFVDDIEAAYAAARAVICPILTGGGTRVKLIEAAVREKAIVSTTVGAEGLAFVDGCHALLRDDAEGFAHACVQLLTATEVNRRLGQAVRKFAADRYDRSVIRQGLTQRLRAVMSAGT